MRPWSEEDLGLIRALRCATGRSGTYARRAQTILREAVSYFADPDFAGLVAISGDRLLGAAVFEPCDELKLGRVRSIGVEKDYQSYGIGTDLKREVMNHCYAAGATGVWSEVHRFNGPMQRVNEKLGVPRQPDPENGKFYFYAVGLEPGGALDAATGS